MNTGGQVLHGCQRRVVGHVDGEHGRLREQVIDRRLVDEGNEVAGPQRGVQRLRLDLQDLGDVLGVIRLEQLGPGFAHHFHFRVEFFQVLEEQRCVVAAVGIVRRATHPGLQALRLGDVARVRSADDRIVDALAYDAKCGRHANLGIGG